MSKGPNREASPIRQRSPRRSSFTSGAFSSLLTWTAAALLVEVSLAIQCTLEEPCPEGLFCCELDTQTGETVYPAECAEECAFQNKCSNEEAWPDLDHGLVCADCVVLVNHFSDLYGSKCSNYCASLGKACLGAWDEELDTCHVVREASCDQSSGSTSDGICMCAGDTYDAPPWYTVDAEIRQSVDNDIHYRCPLT